MKNSPFVHMVSETGAKAAQGGEHEEEHEHEHGSLIEERDKLLELTKRLLEERSPFMPTATAAPPPNPPCQT